MTPAFPDVDGLEVTPEQTQRALADGTAVVVDVREPYEREAGHAAGTRHIPVSELSAQASTLAPDVPVVFVCRVGGRSLMAARTLRAAGREAFSMAGGMLRWDAEHLGLTPADGVVADH